MNKYCGHISQAYSVELHTLVGGKGHGMRLLEVRNGKGLELTISPDRCADISRLIYKGLNMSYMSPCGYVAPAYYDKEESNFLKSFTAGFLTTCGFNNVGNPGEDNGEVLPLHGTIGNTPCSDFTYSIEGDYIHVKALIEDEVIFAHKLSLTRNYYISLLENKFFIEDEIENTGDIEYPALFLYHMNVGYPLLTEKTKLYINYESIKARDARAQEGINESFKMLEPTPNFVEQCYFYKFKKNAVATVYNEEINSGLAIRFDAEKLNCMTEWKMMGVRDYVLGLEPGNCYPSPRSEKRKNGELVILEPGKKLNYRVDVEVFDSQDRFNDIKRGK